MKFAVDMLDRIDENRAFLLRVLFSSNIPSIRVGKPSQH
jgi:hypothetical protein